ncbi:NifB/NifX family molybdenum-iron cluster-binding protein [Lachnospira multipara]|uniref:NifB/NifX family molybdenum-iron cluster-binding protein n=1 Tax=Lachnospira multipara TaxID=28051 RepID=UPI000404CE73|nr:NifB/NifX family molybdenum-iron cluster-binding protein [Lachnospira multipara]
MAYKIAVASSDGVNIDVKFGAIDSFLVYEIDDDEINFLEKRLIALDEENVTKTSANVNSKSDCNSSCNTNSCGGGAKGCGGPSGVTSRVELIGDCRSVVCAKVGFQAQKQFEKKAISVFDIECPIDFALKKISSYYKAIDGKQKWQANL